MPGGVAQSAGVCCLNHRTTDYTDNIISKISEYRNVYISRFFRFFCGKTSKKCVCLPFSVIGGQKSEKIPLTPFRKGLNPAIEIIILRRIFDPPSANFQHAYYRTVIHQSINPSLSSLLIIKISPGRKVISYPFLKSLITFFNCFTFNSLRFVSIGLLAVSLCKTAFESGV